MGWIQDSWHGVTNVGSSTWIAWAAWAAIALAVVTLVFTNSQITRNRRASLSGRRALAVFRIKKIGILLVASFAFIKFTASGCSSLSLRTEPKNPSIFMSAR